MDLINLIQQSIVLTPNERLNRRLHKLYGEQRQQLGETVWLTPPICSLSTWYQQLYQLAIENLLTKKILISDSQLTEIWQQVFDNTIKNNDLIEPPRTVTEMIVAWQTLKQWRVTGTESGFNNTEEAKFFQACKRSVEKMLLNKKWITADDIPAQLTELALHTLLTDIKQVHLFAFDDITPQTQFFLNHLEKYGLRINHCDWQQPAQEVKLHAFSSPDQEYYAMANWAKAELENGKQQIACIVPDLTSSRSSIARIFNEVFYSHTLFENYAANSLFNISGGEPLVNLPMINTLFNLLVIFNSEFDYNVLSNILLSPYITYAETEKFARIKLDLQLRNKSLKIIYNQFLPYILLETCPEFNERWQTALKKSPVHLWLLPSAWAVWLADLLKTWGWPGERILDSQEYQQLEQLYSVLDQMTTLDDFSRKLNYNEFILLLKKLTGQIKFQIKTADTPVQILGMLEAAGSLYDCIWIAGLTDRAWPPAVNPNPYIPFELQRKLNMPHASSQRQYEYSQRMMVRWLNSAVSVHFSYAEFAGDEPLACSPLLNMYTRSDDTHLTLDWPLLIDMQQHKTAETLTESPYLAFVPNDEMNFGSSLFEQYVSCPFQAFAKQRLKSDEFQQPQQSWDARLRGTHAHAVMEKLWLQWQHSSTLLTLSDEEIYAQVEITIEAVLKKSFPMLIKPYRHDYIELEKARLLSIVLKWIKLEKMREPFSVYALEAKYHADIVGLNLRLKIDRVDITDTGHCVLIDYKSNVQTINDWFKTPPTKPQMLIYAGVLSQPPVVITYASLHPSDNKMKFIGVTDKDIVFPGTVPFNEVKNITVNSWDELLKNWQHQLQD
ncbi:MAG: PD-(D/E)XK nuclease family protein, partial [Gammaproteobacteria bacterium]